jgi:pimeloyl-ACP methyl ester carboxylesterase
MKKTIIALFILFQTIAIYGQHGSVVCLHGFFRSCKCMIPLANTLYHEGFKVYLWDYPSRKRTIEEHAARLVQKLQQIAQKYPEEPIHFVSHSMGGVIVRAAVNHPQCPREAKIGKGILLAPPNRGAALARLFQHCPLIRGIFGNKAGGQLLTFSEYEMRSLGEFPSTMQILVLAGKKGSRFTQFFVKEPNDGKVTVEETRLNSPHIHKVLHVSHHWIMTSRESIMLTKDFLTGQEQAYYP